jgi:hypothetical protein
LDAWLAFDREAALHEYVAYAFPEIALKFDGPVSDGATAPASPFEVLTELLQESGVARETVDHRHRFAAAARPFHPQLGDNPRRHGLVGGFMTTMALIERPSAFRTHASCASRIHHSNVVTISHDSAIGQAPGNSRADRPPRRSSHAGNAGSS